MAPIQRSLKIEDRRTRGQGAYGLLRRVQKGRRDRSRMVRASCKSIVKIALGLVS